jgi:hypothetical protein
MESAIKFAVVCIAGGMFFRIGFFISDVLCSFVMESFDELVKKV